jgi:uncharacterized protein (DUF1800 family)
VPVAEAEAAHLLKRTEFVVRPARLTELMGLADRGAAVDNVMNFALNNNPQLPAYLQSEDPNSNWDQYVFACEWWIQQMLGRPRPFQEKIALFWHGHFVSAWWDVHRGYQLAQQIQLYRQMALGSFVDMTQAMAVTPAMLVYLSNADNVKAAPNENFARELMELFTLGVNQYTEADVQVAARAWTGYNYDYDGEQFVYRANKHDTAPMSFFGSALRPWTGPEIINEILVNNAAKRLIAARFIAKKLWEFLAYPNPSATILDSLTATFANSGMQIQPLVRAILMHDEFYSTTARQGLVRTPIEYFVALSYHSGIAPDDLGLSWRAEQTGQQIYQPPNVAGWKSNAYWLNTSAMSGRADFAESVTYRLRQNGGFDNLYPMTAAQAVDYVSTYFGMAPGSTYALSTVTRNALIAAHQAERDTTPYNEWWGPTNLLLMVMLTPEFHMA